MKILAGVDEVGRGSLIGPVYAAAVILNKSINEKLLKDSKSLTRNKREELDKYIKANSIWAIGQASTKEIEKIIILMGSSAMESLTGLNSKISTERGKWKEVIVQNTTYNIIITFNPSYLLRVPENKKHSWEDLKKIKKKIIDLKLNI